MRRRWILVERNIQTVIEFTLPRLQAVISGVDKNGISSSVNWKGGGSFELVYAPPRLGDALSRRKLSEVIDVFNQFKDTEAQLSVG
jgi:adenine-specific DNA-methyltransferase